MWKIRARCGKIEADARRQVIELLAGGRERPPASHQRHTMTTVVLADDHTVVRDGLRVLLEAHADIRVIGDAANGRQAVRLACNCTRTW